MRKNGTVRKGEAPLQQQLGSQGVRKKKSVETLVSLG